MRALSKDVKALTHVNLPFIEERFAPGETIPYDRFVASAEQAAAVIMHPQGGDGHVADADEMIEDLIANGSASDDPDAPLHHDHLPVAFGDFTVNQLVEQAQRLVAVMDEAGESVPAKLRGLAELSDRQIASSDQVLAEERVS